MWVVVYFVILCIWWWYFNPTFLFTFAGRIEWSNKYGKSKHRRILAIPVILGGLSRQIEKKCILLLCFKEILFVELSILQYPTLPVIMSITWSMGERGLIHLAFQWNWRTEVYVLIWDWDISFQSFRRVCMFYKCGLKSGPNFVPAIAYRLCLITLP